MLGSSSPLAPRTAAAAAAATTKPAASRRGRGHATDPSLLPPPPRPRNPVPLAQQPAIKREFPGDAEEDEEEAETFSRTSSMAADYALTRTSLARKAADVQAAACQVPAPADAVVRIPQRLNAVFREVDGLAEAAGQRQFRGPLPRVLRGMDPAMTTYFKSPFACLPTETVPPHLNPDDVRTARALLKPSPRAHEEEWLRTPRPDEKPCSGGAQCEGRQVVCPLGGLTLVAFLFADEEAERARNPADFVWPRDICLLCMRRRVYETVIGLRSRNQATRPVDLVCTEFYNLVNVPGEYRIVDTLGPSEYVHLGVISAVVKLDLCSFDRVPDPGAGVTRFRQRLPVVEVPQPLAEQMRDRQRALPGLRGF